MAKKGKTEFVCQNCGYSSPKYLGRCPNCGTWNQMVEELIMPEKESGAFAGLKTVASKAQRLKEVDLKKEPRTPTGISELDRVLGGGVVPGSLVLIGGDPGIGKSTLLLQMSGALAKNAGVVLYVSGEESASQIKMRAERLGVSADNFYLYPETDLGLIAQTIQKVNPQFVVIDSIQTMQHPEITSAAGSVGQVREVTASLMQLAKTSQIAIFIVGHVTKEGNIAGPKMLEHMVDTVLYFEGDRHHLYRILRTVKNRFGSTNELGIFEMHEEGLKEVFNPSEAFLEERLAGSSGSAIVVSMEGTRPMLVEIQALVTPTMFGNAKRTTSGLDYNRVSLIMAVLEKRAGLLLQNQDAYLKAAGGVKLDEPAIDLAIAISIASSYQEKETKATECFIGELGLTGEIRRVNRMEQRLQEAKKLGFTKVYLPKNNLEGLKVPEGLTVVGVQTIRETLQKVFR